MSVVRSFSGKLFCLSEYFNVYKRVKEISVHVQYKRVGTCYTRNNNILFRIRFIKIVIVGASTKRSLPKADKKYRLYSVFKMEFILYRNNINSSNR